VVTVVNRGIGLALVVHLQKNGLTVVLTTWTTRTGRLLSRGDEAKHPRYVGCLWKPKNAEEMDGGSIARGWCSKCERYVSAHSLMSH
jgi:hypothetical protein